MKKKKNVCGATGMLESLAQQRSEEPVTPKTPCQTLKESIKVENKTGKKKRHYPQKKPVNEVQSHAPLVCRLENLVLLFALMKLLLPSSPLPLSSGPAVNVLPARVATLPSSLLFSTTS